MDFPASQAKPLPYPYVQDADSRKLYIFGIGVPPWEASQIYMLGDKARPSEYNGLMLVCSKGGLSGANEPSGYALGDILLDGSVEWAVKKHSAYLEPGEILLNAGFSADDGVLITDDTFSNEIAQCFVAITDSTLKAFTLTCRFETSLGRTDDRSIKVKVGSR